MPQTAREVHASVVEARREAHRRGTIAREGTQGTDQCSRTHAGHAAAADVPSHNRGVPRRQPTFREGELAASLRRMGPKGLAHRVRAVHRKAHADWAVLTTTLTCNQTYIARTSPSPSPRATTKGEIRSHSDW